jgi:hypothetical protein
MCQNWQLMAATQSKNYIIAPVCFLVKNQDTISLEYLHQLKKRLSSLCALLANCQAGTGILRLCRNWYIKQTLSIKAVFPGLRVSEPY